MNQRGNRSLWISNSVAHVRIRRARVLTGLLLCAAGFPASAEFVTVCGGPEYAPAVGGYVQGNACGVTDSGQVITSALRRDGLGTDLGRRPLLWDVAGMPACELGNLGIDTSGGTYGYPYAINSNGTIVGNVSKYNTQGDLLGLRPARWDVLGRVTELQSLGTSAVGEADGYAAAINAAGTSVGCASKYDASGTYLGPRPVRWDGTGTAATELGNLGTDSSGRTGGDASAINNAGTSVGQMQKYDASGTDLGPRPVRWNAVGTAAIELGILGTDASGQTEGSVRAINDAGTSIGGLVVYDTSGKRLGYRPVRWDASGAATELGILGTDDTGVADFQIRDINNAGTSVGFADKFDGTEVFLGSRPVRWDASGTAAIELDTGTGTGEAFAINDAGVCVGSVSTCDITGTYVETHAVAWDASGAAVNLNSLIDPASGWDLSWAYQVSETGWIAGTGTFDPDGPGGQDAYQRAFVMQFPEPASLVLLVGGVMILLGRRWRSRGE